MRRLVALAILGSLALAVPAGAATRTVSLSTFEFRPARLVVAPGDRVTWRWDGPDTDHSVTAQVAQARTFDSDPGLAVGAIDHPVGFRFAQRFARPGTSRYVCKVHPAMGGVIIVRARARARARRSGPDVRRLRVTPAVACGRGGCRQGGIDVRFVLSERARVVLRIVRVARALGPHRPDRTRRLQGRSGRNDVRVFARGLARGRYRLTVTATDPDGSASKPARAAFRILRAAPRPPRAERRAGASRRSALPRPQRSAPLAPPLAGDR